MSEQKEVRVTLTQQEGYAFLIDFGGDVAELLSDEAPPLGAGAGPNPSQLLLASIANCLAASLTFSLRKFKNAPAPLHAEIVGELVRNGDGRWRIPKAEVEIRLTETPGSLAHLDRVLEQFEEFCIVTQSVRQGIDVEVTIRDGDGRILKGDKSFEAGA